MNFIAWPGTVVTWRSADGGSHGKVSGYNMGFAGMTVVRKPALLIVDDEPALLLSYSLILQQHGYEVVTAQTSDEAYQLLAQRHFDALLCDLGLEKQYTGLEVLQHARQQHPQLACVLLTGYPDNHISEEARRAGIQTLYKPVEVSKLLETIEFMLRRSKTGPVM